MKNTHTPNLRNIPLFSGLQVSACRYLKDRMRRFEFAPGTCIIQQGMRGGFLAIVGEGRVELSGADGHTQTIEAGGTFGEAMLRFGVPSSYTATAATRTTLWVVKRVDWAFASELSIGLGRPLTFKQSRQALRRMRSWSLALAVTLVLAALILYPEWISFSQQSLNRYAFNAGRPELAEAYLRAAADLQPGILAPDLAELYDALGYALYLQGEDVEARSAFEQALSIDQRLASAHNNLGVALLNQSRVKPAIEHLQASVELDPENAEAWLNLGNAFLAAGERRSAAEAYRQVIEIQPDQAEAMALLAAIEFDEGRLVEADLLWRQVLDQAPGHPLALRGLGAIAVLQGEPAQALVDLRAAAAADPYDATTRVYLGLALESLGRQAEAATEFEQALALDDDAVIHNLAYSHLVEIRGEAEAPAQPGKERQAHKQNKR